MGWYKAGHKETDTKNNTASFVHNRNRENIKSGETHSTIFGKIARYFADLKMVAFTGDYDDLNGKPSSFPPSSHKHGKADITDFPSSLPASDVAAWAKAASKPAYNWDEIEGKPSGFTPDTNAIMNMIISEEDYQYTGYGPGMKRPFTKSALKFNGSDIVLLCHKSDVNGGTSTSEILKLICQYRGSGGGSTGIAPCKDGSCNIGQPGYCFAGIYCKNAVIQTSDRELKKEISYIGNASREYSSTYMDDAQLISLILGLKACVYKFKENDSNRPHHGLIAQDVEELLQKLGIKDHAAFIKSPKTRDVEVEEEYTDKDGSKKTRKRIVQEEIPEEYIYGLRYEEFIADIIRFCQILYSRNTELETALEEQKKKAESLEKRIKVLEDIIKQAA